MKHSRTADTALLVGLTRLVKDGNHHKKCTGSTRLVFDRRGVGTLFIQLVRAGSAVLLIALLTACAMQAEKPHGIAYHIGIRDSYILHSSCVQNATQAKGDVPAIYVTLKPGACTHDFKYFTAAHRGETMTAEFDGKPLSKPTRIVSPLGSSFVQPVRSEWQRDRIMTFYHQWSISP